MLNPPLRAEDGAKFFGRIDPTDTGEFRACCFAQLDLLHSVNTELSVCKMCGSVAAAEEWIEQQAVRRSFQKYTLEGAGYTSG